ncbi:MAG: hypothetical protein ACE5JF_08580 [Anaerolineales bacterium]
MNSREASSRSSVSNREKASSAGNPTSVRTSLLGFVADAISLVLVATALVVFAYFLGNGLLDGPLKGSDSPMHIGYAVWIDEYFPIPPHWYPLVGGGVSLLHGYPLVAHFVTVLAHRLTDLSILQAFRLISFITFPLTAIGIYLFCAISLRRKIVGLLAGVFFLIAPVTWTWMHDWGFYASQVAIVFLPLALLAFDRSLSSHISLKRDGRRRLWVVALVLVLILASLTHMMVGAAAVAGMVLLTLTMALVAGRKGRMRIFKEGMRILVIAGTITVLVIAIYLVPFYLYGQEANRDGLNTPAPEQLHRLSIPEYLGAKEVNPREILTKMQFPLVVTSSAFLGLLLYFQRWRKGAPQSRKPLAIAMTVVLASIYVLSAPIVAFVMSISPQAVMLFNFRSLLNLAMILIPTAAALGVLGLAEILTKLAIGLPYSVLRQRRLGEKIGTTGRYFASPIALLIAFPATLYLGTLFPALPHHVSYGPLANGIDTRDLWDARSDDSCNLSKTEPLRPSLCEVPEARKYLNIEDLRRLCAGWTGTDPVVLVLCSGSVVGTDAVTEFLEYCEGSHQSSELNHPCGARVRSMASQLAQMLWPKATLSDTDLHLDNVQKLASMFPANGSIRVDISPYLGRIIQDFSAYSGLSMIDAYTNQVSLIHAMWGYQQNVFYSDDSSSTEFGTANRLNDLGKWFGIEYVFVDRRLDPEPIYIEGGWVDVTDALLTPEWKNAKEINPLQIWQQPNSPPLATQSSRPSVLVVSRPGSSVYSNVFRLANDGLLPYDRALWIEETRPVDSFTVDELLMFDVVFMHGYDYRNGSTAWNLLENYVRAGGALFVDTGWQFWIPEWEFETAPAVLPIEELSWTEYGADSEFTLGSQDIAGNVDISRFNPMKWEGGGWAVSGAGSADIRDWGRMTLAAGGRPLIVSGNLEGGKVIWSGMNLLGHAMYNGWNDEEVALIGNLLEWLIGSNDPVADHDVTVIRNDPDQIDFILGDNISEQKWLYWREAYYPNWHAFLLGDAAKTEIPIYRGGPGMMTIPLSPEATGGQIRLEWIPSHLEKAAVLISILGSVILVAVFLDGLLLRGDGLTWIKIAVLMRIPRPFLGDGVNEDWARRKRIELEQGSYYQGPAQLDASDAIPWLRENKNKSPDGDSKEHIHSDAFEKETDPEVDREKLLESWLSSAGNDQDDWAKRLLDDKAAGDD